jgi:hypothetical protein
MSGGESFGFPILAVSAPKVHQELLCNEGGRREESAGPAHVSEAGTSTTLGDNVGEDKRFALGVHVRNTLYFA